MIPEDRKEEEEEAAAISDDKGEPRKKIRGNSETGRKWLPPERETKPRRWGVGGGGV